MVMTQQQWPFGRPALSIWWSN